MNIKDISFITKYDKYLQDKNGNKLLSGDIFIIQSSALEFVIPDYYCIFEYVKCRSSIGYIFHGYKTQNHISNFIKLNNSPAQNSYVKYTSKLTCSKNELQYINRIKRGIYYRSNWNALPELIYDENCCYLTNGIHREYLMHFPEIF